jgi:hypothetical protein
MVKSSHQEQNHMVSSSSARHAQHFPKMPKGQTEMLYELGMNLFFDCTKPISSSGEHERSLEEGTTLSDD